MNIPAALIREHISAHAQAARRYRRQARAAARDNDPTFAAWNRGAALTALDAAKSFALLLGRDAYLKAAERPRSAAS